MQNSLISKTLSFSDRPVHLPIHFVCTEDTFYASDVIGRPTFDWSKEKGPFSVRTNLQTKNKQVMLEKERIKEYLSF